MHDPGPCTADVSNKKWQRMRLVNGNSIQIKIRGKMDNNDEAQANKPCFKTLYLSYHDRLIKKNLSYMNGWFKISELHGKSASNGLALHHSPYGRTE
jgi:hypothetical protein